MKHTPGTLAVVHSVDTWLPQTMTWLYALVKSLPASIDPHIVCDTTLNLEGRFAPYEDIIWKMVRPGPADPFRIET